MTRIERMKGQVQRHLLWAWRERLCAGKPTEAGVVKNGVKKTVKKTVKKPVKKPVKRPVKRPVKNGVGQRAR